MLALTTTGALLRKPGEKFVQGLKCPCCGGPVSSELEMKTVAIACLKEVLKARRAFNWDLVAMVREARIQDETEKIQGVK